MPVTTPVAISTELFVLLLLHVPPVTASVSVVVNPIHTLLVPDIAAGNGFTVNVIDVAHPVASSVYVISVVPVVRPVTIPDVDPIDATVDVPLLQVPPPAPVSVAAFPAHSADVPVIEAGKALIVIVFVAAHVVASE